MRMTEYQCKHGHEWAEGCEQCAIENALQDIEKATKEVQPTWKSFLIRKKA
jgi:hypothetical protein